MAPDSWIKPFRDQLRSVTSSGWFARPDRHNKVRLLVQSPGRPAQTVQIDAHWSKADSAQVLTIAAQLHKLMQDRGLELRAALRVLQEQDTGAATSWSDAAEGFEQRMAANVKPTTWAKYAEVVNLALAVMASRRPAASGVELAERVVSKWEQGCRRRQQAVQQIARFLRYRVERRQLPDCWLLPTDTSELVGVVTDQTANRTPNKVTELRDDEILELIESCPDTAAGHRWADALRLIAELGLRPHELQFLSVKVDPATGEAYWWCSYEKRAGRSARTSARRLFPCPIEGTQWNLLLRWQAGLLELPPLGAGNGAADALRHYLMRRPAWKRLEANYAARGENIAPYSLRNSYCLRCNRLGIPVSAVAAAMGNTPEVLQAKYTWANHTATAEAFARAQLHR